MVSSSGEEKIKIGRKIRSPTLNPPNLRSQPYQSWILLLFSFQDWLDVDCDERERRPKVGDRWLLVVGFNR